MTSAAFRYVIWFHLRPELDSNLGKINLAEADLPNLIRLVTPLIAGSL